LDDTEEKVELQGANFSKTLKGPHGPAWIGLVDVAWSRDGEKVSFISCSSWDGPTIFAYDIKSGKYMDRAYAEAEIARVLRLRYFKSIQKEEKSDEVILKWACTESGRRATGGIPKNPLPNP
jgi:hypothetical protein